MIKILHETCRVQCTERALVCYTHRWVYRCTTFTFSGWGRRVISSANARPTHANTGIVLCSHWVTLFLAARNAQSRVYFTLRHLITCTSLVYLFTYKNTQIILHQPSETKPDKNSDLWRPLTKSRCTRKLLIQWNGIDLKHCDHLVHSNTYCVQTKTKVGERNNLIRKLVDSKWGVDTHILMILGRGKCVNSMESIGTCKEGRCNM